MRPWSLQSGAGVVAPQRNAAFGTPGELLAIAARGRSVDQLRFGAQNGDAIGLDHGIQRKGCPAFALAPPAVAAVDEQWCGLHAIADVPAVAAALEREDRGRRHDGELLANALSDMRKVLEGEEDGFALPVGQSVVIDKYQFARVEARHRCLCNQSLQDGLVQFRASGQNPQIGLVRTGDE